jgi:flagellin-like hook-associated protein FlgL
MTRIATLATSQNLNSILADTQARVHDLQTQVATGKRSQTYAGIASDSRRLIDLEQRRKLLERYEQNNTLMKARIDATATAVSGIAETIRGFRQDLMSVIGGGTVLSASKVDDLQETAFRALQALEDYLNTNLDGRSLFAGSQVRTRPVDIAAKSLAEFQATWDGSKVIYPPTRAAQVGASGTLSNAITGDLSITQSVVPGPFDTITATNDDAFASLRPGATITISGSSTGNDGTYTVVSSDGDRTITIAGTLTFPSTATSITISNTLNDPGVDAGGNPVKDTGAAITIGNWYRGDTLAQTHRLDDERSLTLDLDGLDPAFEKAIRALGIIAQGVTGQPGGLDAHQERIDQALFLLNDAIDGSAAGVPPFGSEQKGDLKDIESLIGYQQVMLSNSRTLHTQLAAALDDRIGGIENADPQQAIVQLLDATQSLEASYQAIARVRGLNLAQFL